MPVVLEAHRSENAKSYDPKARFVLPYDFIGEAVAESVAQARRNAIAHREAMLGLQKAARDRETAKFFKEEARDALKHYRAACLLLPHVTSDYPGDCVESHPYDWPVELFPALCRISNDASIA